MFHLVKRSSCRQYPKMTAENDCPRVIPRLTTEAVEGSALALQSIDNIERGDSLAFGMLSICDSISNYVFEKSPRSLAKCINNEYTIRLYLQETPGLRVDHSRDTLDTTTAGKTTNSRLAYTFDVVTKNL
jgi:hypothetical protein